MKYMIKITWTALILITGFSHATLTDLGNGIIDDSELNLGWLKDANMYKTLCDANDPIYASWTGSVTDSKETICNALNGKMSWDDAQSWIEHLNNNDYLGFNDWHLPQLIQPDTACEIQNAGEGSGYNCSESELAHLYNISLANPNNAGTGATGGTVGNGCAPCFINTGDFENTQTSFYWYDSLQNPGAAWIFLTGTGYQDGTDRFDAIYVWPVHPSPAVVAAPQTVPTLSNLFLSLMILSLFCVAYISFNQRDTSNL